MDILLDSGDAVAVTRGLLARNDPGRGVLVVHPAPGVHNPVHSVLSALGVSTVDLSADRIVSAAPAWNAAVAWAQVARVTRIVLLRSHLFDPRRVWPELRLLAEKCGADLLLVFHQAWVPAEWARALQSHQPRTFGSVDEVLKTYRWGPASVRQPRRSPPPHYPALVEGLPTSSVLHWRADVHRDCGPADAACADMLYDEGFAAACEWIREREHVEADWSSDERVQTLLTRLAQHSPTRDHTLALLRGAQAGFLAHGHHLAIPRLGLFGGPGLSSTPLTGEVVARIRAGTGNPILAAGVVLALITGLRPGALRGLLVDDFAEQAHVVRIPFQVTHTSSVLKYPTEMQPLPTGRAVFYVPVSARPLLRAARTFLHGAGRSAPHRTVFSGVHRLADVLRATAARCGVTLPERSVDVLGLWQIRIQWRRVSSGLHGCPTHQRRAPWRTDQHAASASVRTLSPDPADRIRTAWSPDEAGRPAGNGLDDRTGIDTILRLVRAGTTGVSLQHLPRPPAPRTSDEAWARELVERQVAIRVTPAHVGADAMRLGAHPDILFAFDLTGAAGPKVTVPDTGGAPFPASYLPILPFGIPPAGVPPSFDPPANRPRFAELRPALRRSDPRPLSRRVTPYPNETCQSYDARLAQANGIHSGTLRRLAGYRDRGPLPTDVYAVLTGVPRGSLIRALPDLGAAENGSSAQAPLPSYSNVRLACRLCVAARGGGTAPVWIYTVDDRSVCVRHQRWVGARTEPPFGQQVNIAQLPELTAAHKHHRNLVRRYGRDWVAAVYQRAILVTQYWTDRRYWPLQRCARMNALTEPVELSCRRIRPADPLIDLINYPESVALASILISPYWQWSYREGCFDPSPRWRSLFAEIRRRTGIADFEFAGASDPLMRAFDELTRVAARSAW